MANAPVSQWNEFSSGAIVNDQAVEDDTLSLPPILLQYWEALLRRRWLIAALVAVVMALGIIYTLLQPQQFTASSRIEISRLAKNITNVQGIEQEASMYDMEFYDTQYALLKSPSLADRVVRSLNLANEPSFFEAHGIAFSSFETAGSPKQILEAREKTAAGLLLGGIAIEPVRSSSLVDVKFTSRSPEWSAKVANAWPREFIAANLDRRLSATVDARKTLEDRLEGLRIKLEDSEQRLITFANSHNIIVLGSARGADGKTTETRSLVASNLEVMNASLMQARADRIAAESRARSGGGDSSSEALQSVTLGGLRARRAELAAEYSRLMVQFEPGYPAARAIKGQIDAIDSAIAQETGRSNRGRRTSYDEALKREKSLEQQVNQLKADYRQQQQDTIQYNIYQREVDTNRQLHDGLLQRYKEIGVAGTVDPSNVLIVDAAKPPAGPSAPSLPRNLILALLLGLGLAGVAVFVLEQLDDTIRSPSDIEQKVHLALLGSVPVVADDPIIGLVDQKATLSEAYFSIRASLALATPHGFPKSLSITSTEPGEGKSTTALALAVILARIGKKVVLVDADMRSPSIHGIVGDHNVIGLSNLLAGNDDVMSVMAKDRFHDVAIMPAGPMPPSAAELLSSDRLEFIVQKLGELFDHVIIDSPPVIGLADAPLLGRAVEGSVFVIEASETSLRAARNALKRLQIGKNHVYGAVATKVDAERFGYGYGYAYSYRYGEEAK